MARRPAATATPEEIERLRHEVKRRESEFRDAKIAYYNSSEYQGDAMPYERLKSYALAFIAANRDLQKALYGRVRVVIDVSRLLR